MAKKPFIKRASRKIAVLADIHADSEMLSRALAAIAKAGCDDIWMLGDVAGEKLGTFAVLQMLQDLNMIALRGNHDLPLINPGDYGLFSSELRAMHKRTAAAVHGHPQGAVWLAMMRSWPEYERIDLGGIYVHLSHGHPLDPPWLMATLPEEINESLNLVGPQIDLLLMGHSHRPLRAMRSRLGGGVQVEPGVPMRASVAGGADQQLVANPGSVMRRRDGSPGSWLQIDVKRRHDGAAEQLDLTWHTLGEKEAE